MTQQPMPTTSSLKDLSGKGKDKDKVRRKPGRVPTSCAECRRLKLRCDRNVPCEKCVSRGCGSICPEGSLATGKGNRLVLANTAELHDRIEHLSSRIRELEGALGSGHPLVNSSSGLLSTGQSSTASPSSTVPEAPREPALERRHQHPDANFIDAFGTLCIGPEGETKFLGGTARSEYLLHALAKPSMIAPSTRLSQRIIETCSEDVLTPPEALHDEVISHLPPWNEAVKLAEVYSECGEFLYCPVPYTELSEVILRDVYKAELFTTPLAAHKLAILFIVFALASLFDEKKPGYGEEAQEYYYLARAALNLAPPTKHPTLTAVQTLIHISQYQELSDWEFNCKNSAWVTLGVAVRLGIAMGVHVNPTRWDLNPVQRHLRDRLFWNLFFADTWMSFHHGRPPSFNPAFVGIALEEDLVNEFHTWTWKYTLLLHSVLGTAFGASAPAYAEVIGLDRKIRDFLVPFPLRWTCTAEQRAKVMGPNDPISRSCVVEPEDEPPSLAQMLQRFLIIGYKESTLLHLHRAYFAQALSESPENLAGHAYLPSVMSTYRSAWRLITSIRLAWYTFPGILGRMGGIWGWALSGAIVMTILVTRAPHSPMARGSMDELDKVVDLFEDAASQGVKSAAKCLETIRNLKRKAEMSPLAQHPDHTGIERMSISELDRLGGRTSLIGDDRDPSDSSIHRESMTNSGSGSVSPRSAFSTNGQSKSIPIPTSNARGDQGNRISIGSPPASLHSTLAHDLHTFEGGSYDFGRLWDIPTDSGIQGDESSNLVRPEDLDVDVDMGWTGAGFSSAPFATAQSFGRLSSTPPPSFGPGIFGSPGSLGVGTSTFAGASTSFGVSTFTAPSPPSTTSNWGFSSWDIGHNAQSPGQGQGQAPAVAPAGMGIQAPILDATWQSFVEQLGF
ncbi:fungal-specific transcription factor domain-containing protein [Mycena floridula]|nr:fungal-specific transcription factor domain-containing protein [Mycena floridula]